MAHAFAAQGFACVSLQFYFEDVLHRDPIDTGFLVSPWSIVVALAAPLAGRLSHRHPPAILGGIGLASLSAGMSSLALLPAAPGVVNISVRMAICGAGFGFFQAPNLSALMSGVPPERSGGASGTIATSRLLGQTTGAALTALCFSVTGGPRRHRRAVARCRVRRIGQHGERDATPRQGSALKPASRRQTVARAVPASDLRDGSRRVPAGRPFLIRLDSRAWPNLATPRSGPGHPKVTKEGH